MAVKPFKHIKMFALITIVVSDSANIGITLVSSCSQIYQAVHRLTMDAIVTKDSYFRFLVVVLLISDVVSS